MKRDLKYSKYLTSPAIFHNSIWKKSIGILPSTADHKLACETSPIQDKKKLELDSSETNMTFQLTH